ncbi:hypothetical protein EVAR_99221_1 [Eumeta japonica]|uniref:Uncharacterized protein n=1 Tax=Eumeta variegata TaxID=151549 RepID=A0A4C1YGX2_EUMVA|nr:hypothetical protein EVAR_99221_1 [Eumeta japonica]
MLEAEETGGLEAGLDIQLKKGGVLSTASVQRFDIENQQVRVHFKNCDGDDLLTGVPLSSQYLVGTEVTAIIGNELFNEQCKGKLATKLPELLDAITVTQAGFEDRNVRKNPVQPPEEKQKGENNEKKIRDGDDEDQD